jgi:MFS transporter, putative metabolite:H+ symporter
LLFLGGLPAALIFVLRRTIPETPQFLASKNRIAESKRALDWIARRPIAIPVDDAASDARSLSLRPKPERILFDRHHRRLTVISWMIYFGSFFGYYGFVLWLPTLLGTYRGLEHPQVLHFMLGLALAGLLGRAAILAIVDRVDRRTLILACAAGGAIAIAGFGTQSAYVQMLIWGYIAAFFLEGIFSGVIPFVAELYPAAARASGVGWAGGMGRIGTALAPLGVGLLVQHDVRFAIWLLAIGPLLTLTATSILYTGVREQQSRAAS